MRKERKELAVLDKFKSELKRFSRDRSSSKLLGKFYKLFNVLNCFKIELETEMVY